MTAPYIFNGWQQHAVTLTSAGRIWPGYRPGFRRKRWRFGGISDLGKGRNTTGSTVLLRQTGKLVTAMKRLMTTSALQVLAARNDARTTW